MSLWMNEDDFRAIGLSMNAREVALGDAWMRFATYDGSARDFFIAMKTECPHYFAADAADATDHPATTSLVGQAEFLKANGEAATRALLSDAGLKLGQIRPPAKSDDDTRGANNPYDPKFSGTKEQRQARIASLILKGGTKLAASLAASANPPCAIDGSPLRPVGVARR